MSYINANPDAVPGDLIAELNKDKIDTLVSTIHLRNSYELAKVYDWLYTVLDHKSKALRYKLEQVRKFWGTDALPVYENWDYERDSESIDFNDNLRHKYILWQDNVSFEEIYAVNEQIQDILKRTDPDGANLLRDLANTSTPDSITNNHVEDIKRATPSLRSLNASKPNFAVDLEKEGFDLDKYWKSRPSNLYFQKEWDQILRKADEIKNETDIPFDQIYHHEKSLIDRVAQLEEDLAKIIHSENPVTEFLGVPVSELVEKD